MSRQIRHCLPFTKPLPITTKTNNFNPRLPSNVKVRERALNFNHLYVKGPEGRLKILSNAMTDLIKYERIELPFHKAEELQGYAERLIAEAMRNGDCHRGTMELADFWLKEKQLIHKLFKVLVPRYLEKIDSFTQLHQLGRICESTLDSKRPKNLRIANLPHIGVLELKENPLPPIRSYETRFENNKNNLGNILLSQIKKNESKTE